MGPVMQVGYEHGARPLSCKYAFVFIPLHRMVFNTVGGFHLDSISAAEKYLQYCGWCYTLPYLNTLSANGISRPYWISITLMASPLKYQTSFTVLNVHPPQLCTMVDTIHYCTDRAASNVLMVPPTVLMISPQSLSGILKSTKHPSQYCTVLHWWILHSTAQMFPRDITIVHFVVPVNIIVLLIIITVATTLLGADGLLLAHDGSPWAKATQAGLNVSRRSRAPIARVIMHFSVATHI